MPRHARPSLRTELPLVGGIAPMLLRGMHISNHSPQNFVWDRLGADLGRPPGPPLEFPLVGGIELRLSLRGDAPGHPTTC